MIGAASVRRYADLLVRFPGAPGIRTGVLVQALAAPVGEVLFRLLDIFKPFPIKALERRLPGGAGVVIDDVVAGVMANLLLRIGFAIANLL